MTRNKEDTIDGRSARRDRNRLAVIDAAIELFSEGNLRPNPAEIADRCGLSLKSVSRYFDDLDTLIGAAAARQMEAVYPLFEIHAIGRGRLKVRIDEFVRMRLKAYDAMGATSRAASVLALKEPSVRQHLDDARRLARAQIEAQFATELNPLSPEQRDFRVAAIDALFQSESLDYYRQHRAFTVVVSRRLLVDAVTALLKYRAGADRSRPPKS